MLVQKFQDEDQALFEAIKEHQDGNKDKSTYIYESTKKYTYKIVHQEVARFKSQSILTGDAISITEDVMQELYIEFFNKIEKFRNEDPRSIFKWISIVSHRMLLDYVDKNKMEVLQFEKDEDYRKDNDIWDSSEINDSDMESNHELLPAEAFEDKEFRQLILDFIQSLPEAQAQTILLHFRGGLKYQEIADEMGVSLITVKTRMKKAKDSLEEIINKYEKKTGTKLYSVSVLPLLWLLYRIDAEETMVPMAVDAAITGSLAGASSAGVGSAVTTGVTKVISTKVLIGIVSATVVIGGAVVGSQLIDKKQETTIEQGDSEDKELDNSNDNKQDNEGSDDTSSKEDKDTSDTENDETAGSDANNQTQNDTTGENNGSDTNNTGSDDNETQNNTGVGENSNGTGGDTSNSGAGENANGTGSDTNNSGNDSGSEDTGNGDSGSESTAAKGTKENPYRIGEKITITDDIVYNPSLYDSQEVYQFEITVTDYIPLEEALAKKGVEFSSGIVLRTVEATVKFTGGITEGLPYEHTPIDLKLLKENGFSYSWSSFMYGADNSCLYAIQNDVEYDIGLNPSYDAEDIVWSYLGIDYYTSDGQWHRVYVKLE